MKNIYLEIIRGFASLFVFIHHILMFFPIASGNILLKFIGAWGASGCYRFLHFIRGSNIFVSGIQA